MLRPARQSVVVVLAAIVAAVFRLWGLASLPRALYHDEAVEGLDALQVLDGWTPIYFPDNNGREPLFVYLAAISISIFGRTPGAIRLVSALAGIATLPGIYLVGASLYNRRVGWLTALIGATTIWPILLSRLGTRPALLPLFLSFGLWQGLEAWRTARWRHWLISGLLFGGSLYTYTPARVMPLALLLFALFLVATGQARRLWPGAFFFSAAFALVVVPLAIYALGNWEIVFGRVTQVSILDYPLPITGPVAPGGRFYDPFAQLFKTLGMFILSGDFNPRHNIPRRPVFDLALAIPFVLGLIVSWRSKRKFIFLFLWIFVGLLPTLLSDNAPHFLRASAILPVLFIFPALGLEWIARHFPLPFQGRGAGGVRLTIPSTLLLLSISFTTRDFLLNGYLARPDTAALFDGPHSQFALEVNRFLGTGWLGDNLLAVEGQPNGQVWLDDRIRPDTEAFHFLVSPDSPVHYFQPDQPFSLQPSTPALLIVPPGDEGERLAQIPPGWILSATDGPRATTMSEDRPPEPLYLIYRAITARPPTSGPRPLACFGDTIRLLDYSLQTDGDTRDVRLVWQATQPPVNDFTVFVHVMRGGELVGQHDGLPSSGLLPTSWWREGEVVEDSHRIEIPGGWRNTDAISVGLYVSATLARLPVSDCDGKSLGDHIGLP